jgi:nicotinamidase-related amidase
MGRNTTASGNTDRSHSQALLIIDMISAFDFPGGNRLMNPALQAAHKIAQLKRRAKRRGVPCIYVNDNSGHWNSDRHELIDRCLNLKSRAADIVRVIEPDHEDYFVLKPRHSGFFATPLQALLMQLQARRLIITGVTAHQCVLFTAVDAHVRDYKLTIPRDCVASFSPSQARQALALSQLSLHADTRPAARIIFTAAGAGIARSATE